MRQFPLVLAPYTSAWVRRRGYSLGILLTCNNIHVQLLAIGMPVDGCCSVSRLDAK